MGVVKTHNCQTIPFYGNMTVPPCTVPVNVKRNLTDGEIKLAKLMYKDSIPYEKVWIIRGGLVGMPDSSNNAMTPYGSIHLPSNSYNEIVDFSTESANNRRWFIHEMAHVWQYFAMDLSVANRGALLGAKGGYNYRNAEGRLMAYAYDLNDADANKEFKNFNIEQQADIISHYYLVKYHAASDALEILGSSLINQQAKRESVLGAFLRNPKDKILKSTNWGGYYRPRGIKK